MLPSKAPRGHGGAGRFRWQLGPTVAIKDSAGRVWRLCGVASPAVKEGETVSAGQTLGKVGSVSCECAEESHIHLEVKQDDSYLDPAKLMQ